MKAAVKVYPSGREVCHKTVAGVMEYRRRVEMMWTRQQALCAICGHYLRLDQATFEHQDGRGMGGGRRDDRTEISGEPYNAAAHGLCNASKGSKRTPYLIQPHAQFEKHLEELLGE